MPLLGFLANLALGYLTYRIVRDPLKKFLAAYAASGIFTVAVLVVLVLAVRYFHEHPVGFVGAFLLALFGFTAFRGLLGIAGSFFPEGHWMSQFDDHGGLD